jgi:hypothetical protein
MHFFVEFTLRKLKPGIAMMQIKNFICLGPNIVFELIEDTSIGEVAWRR